MPEEHRIVYRISSDDGEAVEHVLDFNDKFELVVAGEHLQDWTRLDNHQCPNCPYDSSDKEHCPAAVAVSRVLFSVDGGNSTDMVDCEVTTNQRKYLSNVPYQKAIYSLIGLLMATSGCDRFGFLRPAARFHLPFASLEETLVRNSAFFLFAGSFTAPQLSLTERLKELTQQNLELVDVNKSLLARVRSALSRGDVHRNAMIVLSSFSQILSMDEEVRNRTVAKFFDE